MKNYFFPYFVYSFLSCNNTQSEKIDESNQYNSSHILIKDAINVFIDGHEKNSDYTAEIKDIYVFDYNNDMKKDFLIYYNYSYLGANNGNMGILLFKNNNNSLSIVDTFLPQKDFLMASVANTEINIDNLLYDSNDPVCCPSILQRQTLVLINDQILVKLTAANFPGLYKWVQNPSSSDVAQSILDASELEIINIGNNKFKVFNRGEVSGNSGIGVLKQENGKFLITGQWQNGGDYFKIELLSNKEVELYYTPERHFTFFK